MPKFARHFGNGTLGQIGLIQTELGYQALQFQLYDYMDKSAGA